MFDLVLDCLFPRRSLLGEEGTWMTATELRSLRGSPRLLDGSALRDRGSCELQYLVAAGEYADPLLRRAIRAWKYGRMPVLGAALQSLVGEAAILAPAPPASVLCPVPLHWSRLFWRGFNQSESLAQGVAESRGWPAQRLLRRTRSTGWQAKRAKEERRVAMTDAFAFVGGVCPASVILIDDIATTCATLDACARALRSGGARHVGAIVLGLA